jgi:lipase chaperone LimK
VRPAIIVLCGLTLVVGGATWWSRRPHTDPSSPPPKTMVPSARTDDATAPIRPDAVAPATTSARPASLRGTRIDGALELDPLGHFKANANARRLFDYHLTTSGELPLDEIRARIVAVIERRLPPDAARDAVDLLDRYLLYRDRARQLAATDPGDDDAHARFAAVWALRREVLGTADAEALFGEEEAYDRVALERARIMTNPFLSADDRAQQLPVVDAALPEPLREAREAATLPMRLDGATAALRAAGGGDDDVAALRAETVGADAAERLAALDREEAEWRRRLDAFRDARAAIDADGARSPDDRAAEVRALMDRSFTPTERLRVEALDRLASAPTP